MLIDYLVSFEQNRLQQTSVNSKSSTHQKQQYNKTAPASQFERNVAAMKLAAAYRGRLARKQAEQERRKVNAEMRHRQEEIEEMNRPRPREVLRPKGRSYIGF